MEGETAAGGGGGEGMGFPVHSPGPLPWCQVSEPAVDTGMYTNGQALSWIPNFSEEDFTSKSWLCFISYAAYADGARRGGRILCV